MKKNEYLQVRLSHTLPMSLFLDHSEAELEIISQTYESGKLKELLLKLQEVCGSISRFKHKIHLDTWNLVISLFDSVGEFGNTIGLMIYHNEFESSIFNVYPSDYVTLTSKDITDHFNYTQEWRWHTRYGHELIDVDQEKKEWGFTKFLKELKYWQNDEFVIHKYGFVHLLCLDQLDLHFTAGGVIMELNKASIKMNSIHMEYFKPRFYELSHEMFSDVLTKYCRDSEIDMNNLMEVMLQNSKFGKRICELEEYEDFCLEFGDLLWMEGITIIYPSCEDCEKEIESEDDLRYCDECEVISAKTVLKSIHAIELTNLDFER